MKRKIFFDERQHKYTDDAGNTYTSMTTVIGKYYEDFDTDKVARACERIGRNPSHPKYIKYKGKSAEQIKKEWASITDEALENGTKKHNYLEDIIKCSTGYKTIDGTSLISDRLYTPEDVIDSNFGALDINWFHQVGIDKRYPLIYNTIIALHKAGYKFYAELGVYHTDLLISGMIDLVAIKDRHFIIIDWKTNKADIKFESGYFEKDMEGNLTDSFITTNKQMKYPLHFLPDSSGTHYNLQVSGYAWLLEQFGFINQGNVIYQIRENPDGTVERVDSIKLFDYREYSKLMLEHHYKNREKKEQLKMFL